jgi:hypothetical protein
LKTKLKLVNGPFLTVSSGMFNLGNIHKIKI